MKIYQSINDFSTDRKTIITIGTFDGVHLGHNSILDIMKEATFDGLYESVVLTFFPHPRMVLQQDSSIKLLNTINEKASLLEKFGIDHLIIHPFDAIFSNLSAEILFCNLTPCKVGFSKRIRASDSAILSPGP